MKKLVYLTIVLLTMTVTSCSDFLDRNPSGTLSETSFWQNRSDFESAMTAIYASMRIGNAWTAQGMIYWDNLTDNGFGQHRESQYGYTTEIVEGNITPQTGGFIGQLYGHMFQAIARVNIFLAQLERFEGGDISQADRDRFTGEALFFRAFFYSFLYLTYGNVPLVTEPLTVETQFQPKVEAAQVAAQIQRDLAEAIRLLPDVPYNGRVTRNAARAFKARMIMNDAYDANGNAIPAQMTAALALLNQISGYSLSPNFTDIFQGSGQAGNPEIMFSVRFVAPNLRHWNWTTVGWWIAVAPLTNLIELFQFYDGTPFSVNDPRFDPSNPTANRDPRMQETMQYGTFSYNGFSIQGANQLPTGFTVTKFLYRGDGSHIPGSEWTFEDDSDWVHIRYAEVLLMRAEAENELNGPNAIVYDAINTIRARVNIPPLPAGLTQAQMREEIRRERRVEMAFEGLRYFDLRRWRIIGEVMNNLVEPKIPGLTPRYEPHFDRWPIPQVQIDRSNGVLVQNPGYI